MMNDDSNVDAARELDALLAQRFGHPVEVPQDTPGLSALLGIAGQTSHRAWSTQEVSPALVKLLAACALSAPSKSFLQQADIIEVRDLARREAIHKLVPSMPWMAQAPALLVFCANGRRFKRLCERSGQSFANDHLDAFFNATVDTSLVMMKFIEAANVAGLVTCPISMIRNHPEDLAKILDLPERVVAVAGLCLGYPAQVRHANPRLSLKASFHVDSMDKTDDDTAMDEFDARYIAARSAALPKNAPAPRTWSEERAEQYKTPQRAQWGQFVRASGFDLD